jgi:uracil-DNA glycosylase family 4
VAFRRENKAKFPDFHNAPVETWGAAEAPLLIVGLAPGMKGANRTGRPFTGDASGELLFGSLLRAGFAVEEGGEIVLRNCAITNAVACVPPQNKPIGSEVAACRPYLTAKLAGPRVVLALGGLAHDAVLRALDMRRAACPFSHGAVAKVGRVTLVSSYHPSRYNVSTKRIDAAMLDAAIAACRAALS